MNESMRARRVVLPLAWIRVLALGTWASTVGLIVLGSAVRVTNSGMGCTGWPLCTGAQGTISSFHPMMEESHRLLASIVTILIVALALAVRRNDGARQLRGPSKVAVAVIVLQIILGALTVFAHNASWTVALHLLTATFFLGVVSVVAVVAFLRPDLKWSLRHGPTRGAWAAVIGLYVVVVSGSIVVSAGAQSACATWPLCLHSRAATGLVLTQMAHRSIVLVGSALVVVFLVTRLRSPLVRGAERSIAQVAVGLLALQVLVGAMSAMWSAHTEIADVHLAGAALLWSSVAAVFALSATHGDEMPVSPPTDSPTTHQVSH